MLQKILTSNTVFERSVRLWFVVLYVSLRSIKTLDLSSCSSGSVFSFQVLHF